MSLARIAIVVDQTCSYGRRVHAGIRAGLLPHSELQVRVCASPGELDDGDAPDGIIAAVHGPDLAARLQRFTCPVVNVSYRADLALPRVGVDDRGVGRMAADHLQARHFHHFASVGHGGRRYAQERHAGFSENLARSGTACAFRAWSGESASDDLAALQTWLADLPTPVAIFVTGAELALRLIQQCREIGLAVPEQVAVLAGTDDPEISDLSRPTLSGVSFAEEQIGLEAARLLLGLMAGETPPAAALLIAPDRVIERESTNAEAIGDPDVATALRYIRSKAHDSIGVEDVVAQVGGCRRSLERRFAAALDRSIYSCIVSARLRRAKELLVATPSPLHQIAKASGFAGAQHLCDVFRRKEGMTPGQYRSAGKQRRTAPMPPEPAAARIWQHAEDEAIAVGG